jgi:hypothetical protein
VTSEELDFKATIARQVAATRRWIEATKRIEAAVQKNRDGGAKLKLGQPMRRSPMGDGRTR